MPGQKTYEQLKVFIESKDLYFDICELLLMENINLLSTDFSVYAISKARHNVFCAAFRLAKKHGMTDWAAEEAAHLATRCI